MIQQNVKVCKHLFLELRENPEVRISDLNWYCVIVQKGGALRVSSFKIDHISIIQDDCSNLSSPARVTTFTDISCSKDTGHIINTIESDK